MTNYVWRPPAVNGGWETKLASFAIQPFDVEPFGPMGIQCKIISRSDRGSIIITQAEHDDGQEWVHASIAFTDRDPSYLELAAFHRAVFGRKRFAYQQFVPDGSHISIHDHALHLWGRADGQAVMPYAQDGTL